MSAPTTIQQRNLMAACLPLLAAASAATAEPVRYQLAGEVAMVGSVLVANDARYDAGRGFGYEPQLPNHFSVRVPADGNYRVTLSFAEEASPADVTVKAETRRLMYRRTGATAGTASSASFMVNVRQPQIGTGRAVKLNARELQTFTWDDKLTLEFFPDRKVVRSIDVARAEDVTTVYLAGDSTVTDQGGEPWVGWGQMLPVFFNDTIAVANYAESGRTLRSFRGDRRLDKILSLAKSGDYVFIQFGHNDMKERGEGIGALTSYKADLEQYVSAVRATGATPVLVTSMYRRRFSAEGQLQDTLGDYTLANRQVAKEQNLTLIDLHAMSAQLFSALGPTDSKRAFVHYPAGTFPDQKEALKDDTHFSAYGGYELARCIVEGIRASKLPLAQALVPGTRFDPANPDDVNAFNLPASAARPSPRPEGS